MAEEKKSRSKVISELIEKIKSSESKPVISRKQAQELAIRPSTLELGGAKVQLQRKQLGEAETIRGSLEEAVKRAVEGLKQALKDNPSLKPEQLQARMVVMDGTDDTGTEYQVNFDGTYQKLDPSDEMAGFPTHSAIEMMRLLDKRIRDQFGADHHKDMPLPDDPKQADIVRAVNKLHKQRHEQVDTLVELLAAVASYEAVAEQSPAEIKECGEVKIFVECCNITVLRVLKENGVICKLFHNLEHSPMPGHSKLDMSMVN